MKTAELHQESFIYHNKNDCYMCLSNANLKKIDELGLQEISRIAYNELENIKEALKQINKSNLSDDMANISLNEIRTIINDFENFLKNNNINLKLDNIKQIRNPYGNSYFFVGLNENFPYLSAILIEDLLMTTNSNDKVLKQYNTLLKEQKEEIKTLKECKDNDFVNKQLEKTQNKINTFLAKNKNVIDENNNYLQNVNNIIEKLNVSHIIEAISNAKNNKNNISENDVKIKKYKM